LLGLAEEALGLGVLVICWFAHQVAQRGKGDARLSVDFTTPITGKPTGYRYFMQTRFEPRGCLGTLRASRDGFECLAIGMFQTTPALYRTKRVTTCVLYASAIRSPVTLRFFIKWSSQRTLHDRTTTLTEFGSGSRGACQTLHKVNDHPFAMDQAPHANHQGQ